MNNLIETTEMDLMRVGDTCTFTAYQGFKPEYYITVEKPYAGVITTVYPDTFVSCKFKNDAGLEVEHGHQSGGFAGDGNVVKVSLTPEDYKYRVLEANAKAVAIVEKENQDRLDKLKAYCDKRLEKLIVTN
ncbi:hypothetical protein PHABIO_70 [Pseudomonas phage Phabio]|uniref:Uncharacterized protein n=1 Tax=Pseudomonas phage Phabio TaxID=2006668 RepID=A0A1Y0ST98_9CAUD|nr:hypothetical protein MZD05_gp070 [Pseudomonas phage Phabio]ARV76701.1 hypothetical protein PHABIO_70 [Pseudomonas phage Phabio]